MLPVEVGVHVGVTICKKSTVKAAVTLTVAKREEVAALHHAVFVVVVFCDAVWGRWRVLFLSKNVAKGVKDLKTVKSGDPKINI